MTGENLTLFLVEYEIYNSWWAGYISNEYLQGIAGKYFSRKVKRQMKKYLKHKELSKVLNDLPNDRYPIHRH